MKATLLILGLATGVLAHPAAGETLRLKLEPERDWLLAGRPQELIVKIDLTAAGHKQHRRTPLNLAVVLDRSGSMTGAKIEKARQAAVGLVERLAPGDLFSLVIYSDQARVLVPAHEVADKDAVRGLIERIQAGGRTALHSGVGLGAAELEKHLSAKRINRVILLSDGLANVGPSSPRDLRSLGRALSEKGIAVTTIGLGEDYNEDLMAGLAEASDANYYYVKDTEKLPDIFAKELGELQAVAARELKIEVICPPGVRPLELIGRPERFDGQRAEVRLSHVAGGQNRYLLLRCRVEGEKAEVARVNLSYLDELNAGAEARVTETARISFTNDRERAGRSVRAEVAAQKELLLTAVAKNEARADADAGRYQQAAQKLAEKARVLEEQYHNAPAALQPALRQETDSLQARAAQLQRNQYGAGLRKSLQSEAWSARNAK